MDIEDLFGTLVALCLFIFVILTLMKAIEYEEAYDSLTDATIINVELEGGNCPDRLISYKYEIDGVTYHDIDDVSAKSYYTIGDIITIEYQSKDVTTTRIAMEN